mgnify:CR=1 FL=1
MTIIRPKSAVDLGNQNPGPGSYMTLIEFGQESVKNQFTSAKRFFLNPKLSEPRPGPLSYEPGSPDMTMFRAPKFSIGTERRPMSNNTRKNTPGPFEYAPQSFLVKQPSFSFF